MSRGATRNMNTDLHFSSERADWGTPPEFFARLHEEFNFTLDVCAHAGNAKLDRYLSPEVDALAQPWAPERCFMNPPYGRNVTGKWIAKAHAESERGAGPSCSCRRGFFRPRHPPSARVKKS